MHSILLLDDDDDLRDTMNELFTLLGNHCVAASSVAELIALGDRALACDLAILDVNLGAGAPSGVDARAWLARSGFHGRVVFLTGHARTQAQVAQALALGVRVYDKPMALAELERLVDAEGT